MTKICYQNSVIEMWIGELKQILREKLKDIFMFGGIFFDDNSIANKPCRCSSLGSGLYGALLSLNRGAYWP